MCYNCVPERVDQTAVVTSASTRTDNVRGTAQTVTSDVIGSVEAVSRLLRLRPHFSSVFFLPSVMCCTHHRQ